MIIADNALIYTVCCQARGCCEGGDYCEGGGCCKGIEVAARVEVEHSNFNHQVEQLSSGLQLTVVVGWMHHGAHH